MSDNAPGNSGRRRFLRNLGYTALAGALGACGMSRPESDDEAAAASSAEGMTYRINPGTGDTVSILGYGCMRFPTKGLTGKVDASSPEAEDIDPEAVAESVDYAMAHGINYYDTSPAYCKGQSEAAIGEALSKYPRDSYFIATKLSNFAPSTWPREESVKMFENSLKYLRTDYVDYLLLHAIGGGGMEAFNSRYIDNGILDYLKEQRAAGRIRNLGFSYHGDIRVFDHLLAMMDAGEVHWDFAQIQLNYVDWAHAREVNPVNTNAEYLYSELQKRGIPVVIMEPLLGGRLASLPAPLAAKMKARRPDDSQASWAFRYAGTPEGVLTVLSGMTYMEHLKDNLATCSPLRPVSAEEDEFLQRIALEYLENDIVPCTACRYCMPCPYGVDIPSVFTFYNKCINEDNVSRSDRDPHYDSARRAFLVGYERRIPRGRRADRCIGCGECLIHCPQGIDIPAELAKIDKYTLSLKKEGRI